MKSANTKSMRSRAVNGTCSQFTPLADSDSFKKRVKEFEAQKE